MFNAEPFRFRQARDFGQIVTDTFTFLRQHLVMYRHLLVTVLPILIVASIAMNYLPLLLVAPEGNLMQMTMAGGVFSTPASTLAYLTGLLLTVFGTTMLVGMMHEYVRHCASGSPQPLTSYGLFSKAVSQFWAYLGTGLLMPAAVVISFLFCLLPMFFVGPVLCLAIAAHAIERTGGLGSWGRSYRLVIGDFWPALGLWVVMSIISYMIGMAIQLPLILIGGGAGFFSLWEAMRSGQPDAFDDIAMFQGWFQILAGIISAFANILMLSVLSIAMVLKYFSRVEETEGIGLQEKLAGFDQA